MIVIFGATGKVGGAAAIELRRRGLEVKAVTREVTRGGPLAQIGCEIVEADLQDLPSIERAMQGADGVLVVCPPRLDADDLEADAQRTIEAIGAAIESTRPRAVVAISDYGAHVPAGTGITMIFHRMEARLRAASESITFLRSAEHMQNWLRQVPAARAHGVLPSLHHPITRQFPAVSALDVGVVAAEILATEAPRGGPRVVHVEGPRRYSAADFAEAVARLVERPVVARELGRESWTRALAAGGLGASYAGLVAALQDAHNAGHIDVEPGVGEVRRGPTDLLEALQRSSAPQAR
jgi:NAD(P)H dehydrogenase (quinone)